MALLTNRGTGSAVEHFVQALKDLNYTQVIGDTTAGILGANIWRELPIGWSYRMTISLTEDCEGNTHEGRGIYPDIPIWISESDSLNGHDVILEEGVNWILTKINE